MRRPTIGESLFPDTDDFVALVSQWRNDAILQLLRFVWSGYDLLSDELQEFDRDREYEDLERSITQYLETRVRRSMTGFEPYNVQHGSYEHETRSPAPAQPPQYDLAFVWYQNPRVMFPLEAKVLKTEGDVAAYLADVRDEFLSCRYAPFSCEAAMLAYLLAGSPDVTFRAISAKLPCTLQHHPQLENRPHKWSEHQRAVPQGKPYPAGFRLHHLVLSLSTT